VQLQIGQISLSNHWFKFKTLGQLPINFEEYIECSIWRKFNKNQHVTGGTLETL
jgi:hypothetical protein